ncbi:hypothetical protein ACQPWY_26805 [Pseudonocardia xinjiangensis]|uniref:hypothetical protein n=1 Tax=Pseudonocardia xinjiangensis TaxID=75289 RepID=UPI003D919CBD
MLHVLAGVSYGYLLIGNLEAINSPELEVRGAPEFAEVIAEGLVHVQAATHTGDVLLEATVGDGLTDLRRKRGMVSETLLMPLLTQNVVVTTFWGLVEGFEIVLPEEWNAARVRVTSPRYAEIHDRETAYLPDPPNDAEEISLEFAPG